MSHPGTQHHPSFFREMRVWKSSSVFFRQLLNRIRCGQRYAAMATCALLRAKPISARILGIVGSALLLPGTLVFAPRVLTHCPWLRPLRRK